MIKHYKDFFFASLLVVLFSLNFHQSSHALVKIDKQSIELALKYGMQNQGLGYSTLLGGNWIEGENGILLNIYTPFMLIASKTYHGGFPENPTKEDMKKAKNRYAGLINKMTDEKIPLDIKFAVSLYGKDPSFASGYKAWVEGFGRGKDFILKPAREIRQKIATKDSNANENPYEAINSYYFKFADIELLDQYRFIIEGPDGTRTVFNLKNDKLY